MSFSSSHTCKFKLVLLACALLVAAFIPRHAFAATIAELQEQILQYNEQYEEAQKELDELNEQIASNEARIAEIESELPGQRERAAASIRTLYKLQQDVPGLAELILSSDDFYRILAILQYLDIIQNKNIGEINELIALSQELEQTKAELEGQKKAAEEQQQTIEDALADAISARDELVARAAAAAAAEAAARARALEEAQRMQNQEFQTNSGNTATVQVPENNDDTLASADNNDEADNSEPSQSEPEPELTPEPEPAPAASNTRENFINIWAGRINNYLAGSPLAGYGATFAAAAWDYGVDPRWSPAIACIESGKGANCYRSYNAWGWGGVSWSSWDTAIYSHVAGLASGYGYTISVEAARKYCPPTYMAWYSSVSAQMQAIWPNDSL